MRRLVATASVVTALVGLHAGEVSLASSTTLSPKALYAAFLCIHKYEGAWNANTGNGYYGGLQMDRGFQQTFGSEFYKMWGTANNWPPHVQLTVAYRAYYKEGFGRWPNTARKCGLI